MAEKTKYTQLVGLLNEIEDLTNVLGLLGWDQETYMPPGGAQDRSYQKATITRIIHLKSTSDEIGELLDDLKPYAQSLDPDSDEARLIRYYHRKYLKLKRVSADLMAELARVTSEAYQVWVKAREGSDFALFRPHLEKIIELRRAYANCFAPYDHIYDPLLDHFEPGLKTKDVKEIFARIRPEQVELIKAISQRPQVEDDFLYRPYDIERQKSFGIEVIKRLGYDFERGREDLTAHPFTVTIGAGDVRITTRFMPDFIGSALFSSTHESGHAIYGQNMAASLARTPLSDGASYAIHESQSRTYENLVSRSRDFWFYFYPTLQEHFPEQLGNISMEAFYRGINKVEPSLIRVEADEATYNLHIMLRMDLEIALMEGNLSVKDLPGVWNESMRQYLGLVPPNDALGVLQDVHWSSGYFGYFPTYALGNLISVQLWECMSQDLPNLGEQIRSGNFEGLTGWLTDKVHRHGAKFDPQELVERITGRQIDPEPYLNYLRRKYGDIYGL